MPRRPVGRPTNEKECVGREGVIDAACELLKTTPPSAITRALLARTTGVNPSLIRYYFKDRTAVLVAAAEKLSYEFEEVARKAIEASDGSPRSRLEARVSAHVDLCATYPYFNRLIVEELMYSDDVDGQEILSKSIQIGPEHYGDILKQGVEAGRYRLVDPDFLFSAVVALGAYIRPVQELKRVTEGRGFDPEATSAKYKKFICDLILYGISSRNDDAPPPAEATTKR